MFMLIVCLLYSVHMYICICAYMVGEQVSECRSGGAGAASGAGPVCEGGSFQLQLQLQVKAGRAREREGER